MYMIYAAARIKILNRILTIDILGVYKNTESHKIV